jgi:predicted nucleotidyltransferase
LACRPLKDRDAIISKEGIIFRVYGYWHPPTGYFCDVEYAPSTIYRSNNPKAIRQQGKNTFFKFYEHEGITYIKKKFPQYALYHVPIQEWLVGVTHNKVYRTRFPPIVLQQILSEEPKDELVRTLFNVLDTITDRSSLKTENFGVFGSLLHAFYHPRYSDIDLTIIGKKELYELLETLEEINKEKNTTLLNEFKNASLWSKSAWKFTELTMSEYGWYQRRKRIYNIFAGKNSSRLIKIEFEPVMKGGDCINEYDSTTKIRRLGMVEAYGTVINDDDSPYMPSIYEVEFDQIINSKVTDVRRIVSFVEEFRMQVRKSERIYVVGNLEQVSTQNESFYQIVLTYCPQYYNQVLKLAKRDL